jgi:hypothetical protein
MSALFDVEIEIEAPETPPGRLTTSDVGALLRARYAATNPGNGPRYITAFEVRNVAGFGGYWSGGQKLRTADLLVMDTWESGPVRLIGHEVKVSRSDWLRELKEPEKSQAFVAHVAEWWLVVADRAIVKDGELPDGWGLMAPAGGGLRAVVKPARKPQPPIPAGLLAALLRRVDGQRRAEAAEARSKPFGLLEIPFAKVWDNVGTAGRHGEIQPARHDLRRWR